MPLEAKRYLIAAIGFLFLASLVVVQWMETARRAEEAGLRPPSVVVPVAARDCADCHEKANPGVVVRWRASSHARRGVACLDCHRADKREADAYLHYGERIATVVTPRDCARCHEAEFEEFSRSRHAGGGDIFASPDIFLAQTVEGAPREFMPASPTPGREVTAVNGFAGALAGCQQCHGARVAFAATDGGMITVDDLAPDGYGMPTHPEVLDKIVRDEKGRPIFYPGTWPNTGIGRFNLDGSLGSCSACHGRHDFSSRQARQPESCGRCHVGPDHSQREIFEESKHGAAYRDVKERMGLDEAHWVLGEDYAMAPTCASCHLSGHLRNGGQITHDPGERIYWTHRPPVSRVMDTGFDHAIVDESDLELRRALVDDSAEDKRYRMKEVCAHCHTVDYVNSFYARYDDLVILYNEKFAKPGLEIMTALADSGLRSAEPFDEDIEWTWFYLWHHEGRRARHGASMMAPDHAQWHGMFQVAERFYTELVPQAREMAAAAAASGRHREAGAVRATLDEILARPEHEWQGSAASVTAGSR